MCEGPSSLNVCKKSNLRDTLDENVWKSLSLKVFAQHIKQLDNVHKGLVTNNGEGGYNTRVGGGRRVK